MDDKISALIRKGEALRDQAQYREALKVFKSALSISKRGGDVSGILDATLAIADISRMTGDFDRAINNYEEALEACEALGRTLTAADCMVGMGLSLRAIGMWKEALQFVSAARKAYRREKDQRGAAFSLWAEAGVHRVAGNIRKALALFAEARGSFTSLGFDSGIAYALCGLGGTHRIAGKYSESLQYYRQANHMFGGLKDKFGTAYSHCGIGNAYRMQKRYGDAMRHFRKAAQLYEEIGDIVSYSYTLWSIATACKMKSDFTQARTFTSAALRNFKRTKDPRGVIYCDMLLGEMDFMRGRNAAADKRLRRALLGAGNYGFSLEQCHAKTLLALLPGSTGKTVPLSCYKRIGVSLHTVSIPFNMP
ncbi:MAG TPA: tetratricopeptide repeat protein [Dissulfurispiraceae bacterium]|nr:tetratricopeptide repeat protein [Dissulfurispiraceae bacterium]